jgi:cysteine desulfuration protein SufE
MTTMTHLTSLEKQQKIKDFFLSLPSPNERYEKIIDLGKKLPLLSPDARIEQNLVQGCQSLLYLETKELSGLIYFNADSEALISKGLAALLIEVYSGQPPESLFQYPPLFLQEVGLHQALSPARSNGLASLFKKMQLSAAALLLDNEKS